MVGGVRPNFDDRMREADRLKVRMDVCNGCVRGDRMEKKKRRRKKRQRFYSNLSYVTTEY